MMASPVPSPASVHAAAVMQERGIDLRHHRSQLVTELLLTNADIIITMTRGHGEALRRVFGDAFEGKMRTLGADVSDPYGGGVEVYRACAEEIHTLLKQGGFCG
jgi:protein-tyrosine-phosphatase